MNGLLSVAEAAKNNERLFGFVRIWNLPQCFRFQNWGFLWNRLGLQSEFLGGLGRVFHLSEFKSERWEGPADPLYRLTMSANQYARYSHKINAAERESHCGIWFSLGEKFACV
jgi:hypothetical protein